MKPKSTRHLNAFESRSQSATTVTSTPFSSLLKPRSIKWERTRKIIQKGKKQLGVHDQIPRLNCNSLQHWRCCFHRSLSMFLK